MKKSIAFLVCLILSFSLQAKENAPTKEKAPETVIANTEIVNANTSPGIKNVAGTKRAGISMRQPNRLSVKGAKITKFVADPQMLEIKHDMDTGSLFIVPMSRETTSIFVMTDTGQTHDVVLTPSEKLHSQNLEIEEKAQRRTATSKIPMDTALPIEESVQGIFRDLITIVSDRTLASKNSKKPMINGPLKATADKKWQTGSYWLEHWTLANTSAEEADIEEASFWEQGILSIAIDRVKIRPGEQIDLWIVRQGGVL